MRTKDANPKAKKKLLDCAQALMLAKGFAATSLEEICKKADLTKGCFFHYFKSKEDLGKALVVRFCCSSQKMMQQKCCCDGEEKDPLKRIYSHIDFAIQMSRASVEGKGCLIGTFAQELSDTHPKIRSLCAEGFAGWAKILRKDLAEAKAKYVPRASFDVKSLADYFIAVVEGSQILAKANKEKKIVEKNMQHFKQYLEDLFKR